MAIINGTSKDETLTGTGSADSISGAGGNDTLIGLGGADFLDGGTGNDKLFGGLGNDILIGGDGNDTLDGGTGNDKMTGGKGGDIYIVGSIGDTVTEASGQGTDEVRTTLASYTLTNNVENLTFTGSGNFAGTGNGTHNKILGGSGNDTLRGLGGNDQLDGGLGNDILDGGDGNDTLGGGTGNDKMTGGKGGDIYIVGSIGDTVTEASGQGTDEVRTTLASYTLTNNVENLTFTGSGNFAGTGNGTHNKILGGSGNDTLRGLGGNDQLDGGLGNDILDGGSGNDMLAGGAGNDTLIGGGGLDAFDGGAGDDVIVVGSMLPADVDGGSGIDRVKLDALGATIDLSGAASGKFANIEKLDLGGTKANTLVLDAQAVLDMAGGGGAVPDNTLLVKGDAGDAVRLAGSWTKDATVANPFGETGTYVRYTTGQARVLVESELTVLTGALAAIDLATLDGTNGFTLIGVDVGDNSGAVSDAGDVNGDGFADVIVGAPNAESAGGATDEGESYVVFGKASWAGTPALALATLDGTNGFRLIGIDKYDRGGSVSSAGDVNSDGFADLIVGAPSAESAGGAAQEGESYVVFGKASWAGTPALDLATLDGINGFRLIGAGENDFTGTVSSAGDVNGDGFDDLIIGAPQFGDEYSGPGVSYVVFGKASWAGTPALDLATLDGTNGFRLSGVGLGDTSGDSVSSAGDVNGDGFADVIVGAPEPYNPDHPYGPGQSYVVFGKASWAGTPSLGLSNLDGTNGFRLAGTDLFHLTGSSVSSAGDVNGDGFADLIVGAPQADGGSASAAGESYVVFGKASWAGTPSLDLATLDGTNGFRLSGIDAFDFSGSSVSSAGDVNGDGFADLIVGAPRAESAGGADYEGESYVVYGKASWAGTPSLDLATLDGTNGFRLIGADGNDFSGGVSSAGDVNGDGFADLIVGASGAESAGGATDEGESYVVFGGNFTGEVTHLGGPGNDTLTGTAAAETFVGGTGNDTLIGKGGADAFQGGAGDDVVRVSTLGFHLVDGGNGVDTLELDGSGLHLNLRTLADSRTRSIERIDIGGNGNNTLTLSVLDVLDLSDESNELLVLGETGDVVNRGAGWTAANSGGTNGNGTSTIDGEVYQIYNAGQAALLVDTDMTVNTS